MSLPPERMNALDQLRDPERARSFEEAAWDDYEYWVRYYREHEEDPDLPDPPDWCDDLKEES